MSVSTDGLLFYGWLFEEGAEFPWEDYEEEEWWKQVAGYKKLHDLYDLYDRRGVFRPGVTPEMVTAEYEHQREWDKANPLPFKVVNYCSDSCPIYALAVGEVLTAARGYPIALVPSDLVVDEMVIVKVREVCRAHGVNLDGEPKWYLASYWG